MIVRAMMVIVVVFLAGVLMAKGVIPSPRQVLMPAPTSTATDQAQQQPCHFRVQSVANLTDDQYVFVVYAADNSLVFEATTTQRVNVQERQLSASLSNEMIYLVRVIDPTQAAVLDVSIRSSSCGTRAFYQAWPAMTNDTISRN